MTQYSFIIPKYNDEMSQRLTSLYDEGGHSAICEYVNEFHSNWDWQYCEPCDVNSPVWKYMSYRICAACFSDFDFEGE